MNEYKNIDKIRPEKLLGLMREILDQSYDFQYISGQQPFFMSYANQKYYVYVKNVSSAYFSDRDKTTRAQLPIKPEFDLIKSSPYPFIFLGYDGLNDVLICWNYNLAKERLNVGKSVSFYSRTFFQSEVKEGEFVRKRLKNGDFPVLFKRSFLNEFFKKIETFFPNEQIPIFNYNSFISKINNEEGFKSFLANNKKLSDKSISNYSSALSGRITEGIKKYFIPTLETIYLLNDETILEKLKEQFFEKEEYNELNTTGKNIYSCAFDNYIAFIKHLNINLSEDNQNYLNEKADVYNVEGKLSMIEDTVILNQINPYLKSNRILSAAQIVGNHYQYQYPKMELSDWIKLIKNTKEI
jgi:hypothetical protein